MSRHHLLSFAVCCAIIPIWFTSYTALSDELVPPFEMKLEKAGPGKMKLLMINHGKKPISMRMDVSGLERSRFLDFPNAAAFELRGHDMRPIEMSSGASGWFYPSILNSTIDQSIFVTKGAANSSKRPKESPLDVFTLMGKETKVIVFEYQKALSLSENSVTRGEPEQFRVKVDVTVEVAGQREGRPVVSEWIALPRMTRAPYTTNKIENLIE